MFRTRGKSKVYILKDDVIYLMSPHGLGTKTEDGNFSLSFSLFDINTKVKVGEIILTPAEYRHMELMNYISPHLSEVEEAKENKEKRNKYIEETVGKISFPTVPSDVKYRAPMDLINLCHGVLPSVSKKKREYNDELDSSLISLMFPLTATDCNRDIDKEICEYLGISDDDLTGKSGKPVIHLSTIDGKQHWMDDMVDARREKLRSNFTIFTIEQPVEFSISDYLQKKVEEIEPRRFFINENHELVDLKEGGNKDMNNISHDNIYQTFDEMNRNKDNIILDDFCVVLENGIMYKRYEPSSSLSTGFQTIRKLSESEIEYASIIKSNDNQDESKTEGLCVSELPVTLQGNKIVVDGQYPCIIFDSIDDLVNNLSDVDYNGYFIIKPGTLGQRLKPGKNNVHNYTLIRDLNKKECNVLRAYLGINIVKNNRILEQQCESGPIGPKGKMGYPPTPDDGFFFTVNDQEVSRDEIMKSIRSEFGFSGTHYVYKITRLDADLLFVVTLSLTSETGLKWTFYHMTNHEFERCFYSSGRKYRQPKVLLKNTIDTPHEWNVISAYIESMEMILDTTETHIEHIYSLPYTFYMYSIITHSDFESEIVKISISGIEATNSVPNIKFYSNRVYPETSNNEDNYIKIEEMPLYDFLKYFTNNYLDYNVALNYFKLEQMNGIKTKSGETFIVFSDMVSLRGIAKRSLFVIGLNNGIPIPYFFDSSNSDTFCIRSCGWDNIIPVESFYKFYKDKPLYVYNKDKEDVKSILLGLKLNSSMFRIYSVLNISAFNLLKDIFKYVRFKCRNMNGEHTLVIQNGVLSLDGMFVPYFSDIKNTILGSELFIEDMDSVETIWSEIENE